MKKKSLFSCQRFGLCALLLALIAAPVKASAESPPFEVRISLATPAHITPGEPVMVRCDVVNVSGRTAVVHLRDCATDWYTVSVRGADGMEVPLSPDAPTIHSEDVPWIGDKTLLKGDTATECILVSKLMPLTQPGTYTVTIRISLQYTITPDPESRTLVPHRLPQTESASFVVTAGPHDAARLHAVAEQLRTAMFAGNSLLQLSMDALFSMPASDVSAVWKEAALTPSFLNDRVASQLEDTHTQAGADILVQMLDAPNVHRNVIADCIGRMYNAGTPALRDHIKRLGRQRGFDIPEQVPVPDNLTPPNTALLGGTLF